MSTMHTLGFLGMPGGIEWLVVLIVALLLFGSRLPKIMRGLGSSVREFREGMDEEGEDEGQKSPASKEASSSQSTESKHSGL